MNTPELGVLVFMLVAVLSALTCYGLTRMLLRSRAGEDSELLTARIIGPLGALHALILALIFAQEMADYRDIARIVSKEASSISDVYHGLQEYDRGNSQATAGIRDSIIEYINTVLEKDPAALAEHKLSRETLANYHRINRQLNDLEASGPDQDALRARMLSDWDAVSGFHMRLSAIAEYEIPDFFWVVIIAGFISVVIPCYVYSPKPANLVVLGTYAGINGLVVYVIFSIGNPFTGPLAIDSSILENLLAQIGSGAL